MECFEDIDTKNPTLKALDLILAAWDEGVDTGVEPQQMAYAALFTALTDLVAIYGEDAVIHLTRGLEKRVVEGEFTLARRDQKPERQSKAAGLPDDFGDQHCAENRQQQACHLIDDVQHAQVDPVPIASDHVGKRNPPQHAAANDGRDQ